MNLALLPLVALVGGIGAIARYAVIRVVVRAARRRSGSTGAAVTAPELGRALGTASVNLLGAAAAGALFGIMGPAAASVWGAVLGVGFLGAFTTFSAWMLEVVGLWLSHRRTAAILHLFGTLVTGVVLAATAYGLVASG
ncbi:MAG: CrcB family protein [Gemmatimonadota bacterium]